MKAILLVGGEGTRLRPLTLTTPKPLLPLANRPFVERQIEWLAQHGVDEVVLSLGYRADRFVEHFPDAHHAGVHLRYAVEPEPLGTAGGIKFAAGSPHERVIVCNGDILTNMDLGKLLEFHEMHRADATIALTQVADPSAFGVVPTRDDGQVIAFVEKPPTGQAPTDWINAGTYILEPRVLEMIPDGLNVSIEREIFPQLLVQPDGRLFANHSNAYWLDMGTPEQYLQAHLDLLSGQMVGLGPVDTRGDSWGVGASIDEDAEIAAPSVLGEGTRVQAGAQIASSVIGKNCTIEMGAIVEGSVVMDGTVIEARAHIVDSILGFNAHVGSGSLVTDRSILADHAVLASQTSLAGGRVEAE